VADSPKRIAVIRAATTLFSRHGFRKTSMEDVAREAGVAKPTLYAHFSDKEQLFEAVCTHFGEAIIAQAHAAADGPGTVIERVTGVLSAKFTAAFELVEMSPYAQELLDTQRTAARRSIETTTAALEHILARVLTELDLRAFAVKAPTLARQLIQVGHGASYGAHTTAEQRKNLAALVELVLHPAKAGRKSRARS
jgi:AcrR family transcriptional regulator